MADDKIHLDDRQWKLAVKEFWAATNKDLQTVLRDQGRLFTRDVAKYTPPTGRTPNNESWSAQKRAGEEAIKNDMLAFARPIKSLSVISDPKNKVLRERLKNMIDRKDYKTLIAVLQKLGVPITRVFEKFPTEIYDKFRGKNSKRIRKGKAQPWFVIDSASYAAELKNRQKKVGEAKSGWRRAAAILKATLPGWVTRRKGDGGIVDDTGKKAEQSITLWNAVEYAQRWGASIRILDRAMDNRIRSMKVQTEHIIKKNADKYSGK